MLRPGSDAVSVEQTLVKKEGVADRVAELYESERLKIYRFLVAQGLDPATAQDLTQDVFVKMYTTLMAGTPIRSERGWLYTVAGHMAVDYWRREGGPMWVAIDALPEYSVTVSSDMPSPDESAIERERLRRAAHAICSLPKEQRMAIQLRMQGLRYREIAEILGVSKSSAAEWLSYAVERLRSAIHG